MLAGVYCRLKKKGNLNSNISVTYVYCFAHFYSLSSRPFSTIYTTIREENDVVWTCDEKRETQLDGYWIQSQEGLGRKTEDLVGNLSVGLWVDGKTD